MSKYYDIESPFSIDNWNLLIEDVNNILQNPPEGSNCQPIEPIEEVSDPHRWSVDDIDEVHDKLIETCPDINFQEKLEIWRPEIIDEIETQMEDAWCNCSAEPDEFEKLIGVYQYTPCNAVMNTTQQGLVEGPISPVCQEVHTEYMYGGSWYPTPNNDSLTQIVCETYSTAYEAVRLFLIAMNTLPDYADSIDMYQESCDYYTGLVDADIELLDADPELWGSLAPRICSNGQIANEFQGKLDEKVDLFKQQHQEGMDQAQIADAAAATNYAAALSLQGRFPPDRNLITEAAGSIPAWNWYDWWNPETMDNLSKIFNHTYNSTPSNMKRDGVYTTITIRVASTMWGTRLESIRYSPNGTCYLSGQSANRLNKDYTKPYYDYSTRSRCEEILGFSCEPDPGNCNFFPWEDHGQIWWDQGWPRGATCAGNCGGFCSYIWSSLDPALWWKTYHSETCVLEVKRPAGVENNASKRDEWFDKYLNWYEEHPKYDDRHESYC